MAQKEPNKLYRSRADRMLFGVCGGIGEYFKIDSVIIRLIFIVLTIAGGSGIILYIIAAIIIPEEPNSEEKKPVDTQGKKTANKESSGAVFAHKFQQAFKFQDTFYSREMTFGLIVILIGLVILIGNYFPVFTLSKLWPLILIAIGAVIIANSTKEKKK